MASSKKKTTFTKLARESRLRERRLEKQAKKDARKRASVNRPAPLDDALANGETSDAHPVGSIGNSPSSPGAV
jgi:hypothetical protein